LFLLSKALQDLFRVCFQYAAIVSHSFAYLLIEQHYLQELLGSFISGTEGLGRRKEFLKCGF
jgi:hypothetical protein